MGIMVFKVGRVYFMNCRLVDLSSGKYDVLHKIPPSLLPSSNKILLWAYFLIEFVWHRDRNISGICGCHRLYCVLFKVEMLPFRAKNSIFTVEQCTIKVADDRFTGIVEKRGLSSTSFSFSSFLLDGRCCSIKRRRRLIGVVGSHCL